MLLLFDLSLFITIISDLAGFEHILLFQKIEGSSIPSEKEWNISPKYKKNPDYMLFDQSFLQEMSLVEGV